MTSTNPRRFLAGAVAILAFLLALTAIPTKQATATNAGGDLSVDPLQPAPEFFGIANPTTGADVTCDDGRPARVPADDRFAVDIPVVTGSGRVFDTAHDFQRDYDRRLTNGQVRVRQPQDGVEIVVLGDRDLYRPSAAALCAVFGTTGTLRDVLGNDRHAAYLAQAVGATAGELQPIGLVDLQLAGLTQADLVGTDG